LAVKKTTLFVLICEENFFPNLASPVKCSWEKCG